MYSTCISFDWLADFQTGWNYIGEVKVGMLASSGVDCGLVKPKTIKLYLLLLHKHAASSCKSKDWIAQNHDDVIKFTTIDYHFTLKLSAFYQKPFMVHHSFVVQC